MISNYEKEKDVWIERTFIRPHTWHLFYSIAKENVWIGKLNSPIEVYALIENVIYFHEEKVRMNESFDYK